MSNIPEIIIDGFQFDNMEAMKYWNFPRSYDQKRKKEESKYMCLSEDYYGSRKMDGAWNMLIKDMNGNFHLRSRTESVNGGYSDKAEWIPHVCKELKDIPNGTVLLGEIYFPNNEGSRKITSVLNCLKDKCIKRQEKNGWLHYYVFDILAWDGKNLIDCPFEKRCGGDSSYLCNFDAVYASDYNYIEVAQYVKGKDLWDLYGKIIATGGEGIVITRKDCKYLCGKRTARMTLKMKKEINDTIDAFIDGGYKAATKEYKGKTPLDEYKYWQNERTGKISFENRFEEYINGEPWEPVSRLYALNYAGSIRFSVMKDGKEVPIGYISGIPDEIKKGIVENPDKYIHKVFELSAMEVECISGEYSLRHGIIIQERPDKNYLDCDFSQISHTMSKN